MIDLTSYLIWLPRRSYQCVEITEPSAALYALLVILDHSAGFPP